MGNTNRLFRPSEYLKPANLNEAVRLLQKYGDRCRAIAGGTDLLVDKDPRVEVLVDISNLGLSYIRSDSQGVRIGATTTFAELEASPILRKNPYSVLAQAASQMGTPQIRNMATVGGNICSAVPSADSAPALLVLDAIVHITGPHGERSMDIADFFRGPRQNALMEGELVTELELPSYPEHSQAIFLKEGRVVTADLAIVNVAVRLTLANNVCQDVRIALGAVAPIPLRAKEAEAMLKGQQPREELLRRAAIHASQEIKPISDIRSSAQYRRTLSRILVEEALREVVAKSAPPK